MGSYADDAQFMNRNDIEYIELISDDGESKVMVVPAWQGRVMTTSAAGDAGGAPEALSIKAFYDLSVERFCFFWHLFSFTKPKHPPVFS